MFKRLDTPLVGNYVKELEEDIMVKALIAEITDKYERCKVRWVVMVTVIVMVVEGDDGGDGDDDGGDGDSDDS